MKRENGVTYSKLKRDVIYVIIVDILFIFVLGLNNELTVPLFVTLFTFLIIPDAIQCIDLSPYIKSIITIILSVLGISGYIVNEVSIRSIKNYIIVLTIIIVASIMKYKYSQRSQ